MLAPPRVIEKDERSIIALYIESALIPISVSQTESRTAKFIGKKISPHCIRQMWILPSIRVEPTPIARPA
eukprot:XP_001710114.1 Hypothetical protein GL50803_95609 [Giardia lamblia ATCC 50803]